MAWLQGRPVLGAALGAIGGPLAFLAGERLGAVDFPRGHGVGLASLAVVWGVALPFLFRIAGRTAPSSGAYRLRGNQGKNAGVRAT